jgi:hypothetical protein
MAANSLARPPMRDFVRRAVAVIAGGIVTGTPRAVVYDHGAGRHFNFAGSADAASVNVYDCERQALVHGSPRQFFHAGTRCPIEMTIVGATFNGFDHDTTRYFHGHVIGSSVQLYDHDDGQYHAYALG